MSRHRRERRRKGPPPLRTPEQHRQFIADNWDHLAAVAWWGYQQEGRGFINVNVTAVPDGLAPGERVGPCVLYVSAKRLAGQSMAFPNPAVHRLVEQYDPEREVLTFFHWEEGAGERHDGYRMASLPAPKDTLWLGDVGQIKVRV
jgi:hypothetical protein